MTGLDAVESKAELVIRSLARKYYGKLPACSVYEYDDMLQEGWFVYAQTMRGARYKPDKANFNTLLWSNLSNHFKNLLRQEHLPRKKAVECSDEIVRVQTDDSNNPERQAIAFDAVCWLAAISWPLARFVVDGPSDHFWHFLLWRDASKKRPTANATITKKAIEIFFNINLSNIRQMGYKVY